MPNKLIEQEELDDICPFMVEELELVIAESDTFKDADEATIYALCQTLHNKLKSLDVSLEDKGAVVATLIQGLVEFNEEALALHREFIGTLLEQKASTIH